MQLLAGAVLGDVTLYIIGNINDRVRPWMSVNKQCVSHVQGVMIDAITGWSSIR